ncbi:MAG: CRISPR-associated helicase Cas3' [Desulfurococcaceae archaeon]
MSTSVQELIEKRPGLKEALNAYTEGYNVVLIAPTSYGKTILSHELLRVSREKGISAGVIHVAPYRALVREIFLEKFKPYEEDSGWQMHGELVYEDKSPYYMRSLVVTTLDSFVYNLYRIPVAEMKKIIFGESRGHYYPVLASIFTSTIVFDEAHSYLNDVSESPEQVSDSVEALRAALDYLSYIGVPIVVETATMKSGLVQEVVNVLEGGGKPVKVIYVGDAQQSELKNKLGSRVHFEPDDSFFIENSFTWETEIVDNARALEIAKKECREEPVLFVRNTVKRAVETYEKLKETCEHAVLVHGLLSDKDKLKAVEIAKSILKERKGGVIVSTQVIEAGVEIGGSLLITDAAPLENLAQRAGRLCRKSKEYDYSTVCREKNARVVIVETDTTAPYHEEAVINALNAIREHLEKGVKIDWRLLRSRSDHVSFATLLEKVRPDHQPTNRSTSNIFEMYLKSDATPSELINLMEHYRIRLLNKGYLVSVMVPSSNLKLEDNSAISNLEELMSKVHVVTVEAERLFSHEEKSSDRDRCLEYYNSKPMMVVVRYYRREVRLELKPCKHDLKEIYGRIQRNAFNNPWRLLVPEDSRGSSVADVYLLARSSCYESGVGLKIWS